MENSIKNERSSIEEYVEILERFSNENVIYGSTVGMTLEKYKDLQLSAEHVLSDYKRLLKENEKLKNKLLDILEGQKVIKEETSQYIKENYVLVEKIKKELKELKEEYMNIQEIKKEKGDFGEEKSKIQTVLLYKIEALQDLLNWGEE